MYVFSLTRIDRQFRYTHIQSVFYRDKTNSNGMLFDLLIKEIFLIDHKSQFLFVLSSLTRQANRRYIIQNMHIGQ